MNIQNRTIYCKDNLDILRGINSETIDMIYLDPPFNKNTSFHAPIGSNAEGASFKDIFGKEDIDPKWGEYFRAENEELYDFIVSMHNFATVSDFSYIAYMGERILECHRVLKDTGSIFYHCDDTMQHYIKIMLDIVFGRNNFRNEINWQRHSNHSDGKKLGRITDAILYYGKTSKVKWNVKYLHRANAEKYFSSVEKNTGRRFNTQPLLTSNDYKFDGEYRTIYGERVVAPKGKGWKWSQDNIDKEVSENQHVIHKTSTGGYRHKLYMDQDKGFMLQDLWTDILNIGMSKKEKVGYPTQKPLTLLRRLIEISTDEGDFIVDPFCGCATACVAAEQLNRHWVGIDISQHAYELVKERCVQEIEGFILDKKQYDAFGSQKQIHFKVDPPVRDKEVEKLVVKEVYVLMSPAYPGWYKVGIASNMKQRKNNYQTSSPFRDYQLSYSVKTHKYRSVEKSVHDNFENKHEWVRADLSEIINFIESLL